MSLDIDSLVTSFLKDEDILRSVQRTAEDCAKNEGLDFGAMAGAFYGLFTSACVKDPENLASLARTLKDRLPNRTREEREAIALGLATAWARHHESRLKEEPPNEQVHDWLSSGAACAAYLRQLKIRGFDDKDALDVLGDARRIARHLLCPETRKATQSLLWRGLTVGRVQSGKTASMGGVISHLADSGYNLFIVLSGNKENLRRQTQKRLQKDLSGYEGAPRFMTQAQSSGFAFAPEEAKAQLQGSRVLGNASGQYVVAVVIKYVQQLKRMADILARLAEVNSSVRAVIIDDEADQASLNANASDPDRDPTKIHAAILRLLYEAAPGRCAYLAYTATPFGNLLNEFDTPENPQTLEPADYIHPLPKSPKYFGMSEIFGLGEYDGLPLVRGDISEKDVEQIKSIDATGSGAAPSVLLDAMRWFFIATAIRRARGLTGHTTMLVHTSQKVEAHEGVRVLIEKLIRGWATEPGAVRKDFEKCFEAECGRVSAAQLREARPQYGAPFPSGVPAFTFVWKQIVDVLGWTLNPNIDPAVFQDPDYKNVPTKVLRIISDNSQTDLEDRLGYPPDVAWAQIVVGGNTLSRGLTLENLVSSFFSRSTGTYDSLMQMGRWFGYRLGYEDLPRIWITPEAVEAYETLAEDEEYLMAQIRQIDGIIKPRDVKILIRGSLNRMKATRFMNAAAPAVSSPVAGGERTTRSIFVDETSSAANKAAVEAILSGMPPETGRGSRTIFRGLDWHRIDAFLAAWQGPATSCDTTSLRQWLTAPENETTLRVAWNVALIGGDGRPVSLAGRDYPTAKRLTGSESLSPKPTRRFKQINSVEDLVADLDKRLVDTVAGDLAERLDPDERKQVLRSRYLVSRRELKAPPLLLIFPIETKEKHTVYGFSLICGSEVRDVPAGVWITQKRAVLGRAVGP